MELDYEGDWSEQIGDALKVDLAALKRHTNDLHEAYFSAFTRMCRVMELSAKLLPSRARTDHPRLAGLAKQVAGDWFSDAKAMTLFRRLNRKKGQRNAKSSPSAATKSEKTDRDKVVS